MFTGIIETLGIVENITCEGSNKTFYIKSPITNQLKIDQSVCHNGVCLTIEDIQNDVHRVTAIKETLDKTNAGKWENEETINLERSLQMDSRLDGHIVQGHVDGTAICKKIKNEEGSVEFIFRFKKHFAPLIIEKGSICINGVSLTAFDVSKNDFTVAIIPYTFSHTNFSNLKENGIVNIEFDILGKYVQRIITLKSE